MKHTKSAPKSFKLENAVKAYASSCCNVLADKPSVRDSEGSLGKWRCRGCGKRTSVRPVDKSKMTPGTRGVVIA